MECRTLPASTPLACTLLHLLTLSIAAAAVVCFLGQRYAGACLLVQGGCGTWEWPVDDLYNYTPQAPYLECGCLRVWDAAHITNFALLLSRLELERRLFSQLAWNVLLVTGELLYLEVCRTRVDVWSGNRPLLCRLCLCFPLKCARWA
ncbi:hypothetical protein COO60DRAFT_1059260 [Scenedesmus sp. NREL 46B-D3]|nr:hypothetical protein COO60DRAFT_1059260 [Scenedesmus sp. NREL 46B-D3]